MELPDTFEFVLPTFPTIFHASLTKWNGWKEGYDVTWINEKGEKEEPIFYYFGDVVDCLKKNSWIMKK